MLSTWCGELGLAALTVSIATAVRRVVADEEMLFRLMASIAAFVVFSVASGLAQWYVATLHLSPTTTAGQAALIFRVAMPVAIDLASMLYLSIMKVKSLKRYLAEMARDAGRHRAGQQEPSACGAGASLRRTRPSSSIISFCARWKPREPLVIDLQRIITGHMVTTATAALTGRSGGEVLVQALPAAGETAEPAKAETSRRKSGKAITAQFEMLDASQARDKRGFQPRQRETALSSGSLKALRWHSPARNEGVKLPKPGCSSCTCLQGDHSLPAECFRLQRSEELPKAHSIMPHPLSEYRVGDMGTAVSGAGHCRQYTQDSNRRKKRS